MRRRGAILRFSHRLRSDLRARSRPARRRGDCRRSAPAPRPRSGDARSADARCDRPARAQDGRFGPPLARHLAARPPRRPAVAVRQGRWRLARTRPLLIERPRRSAEAVSRTFVREAALLARRRGERGEAIGASPPHDARHDERLQARRAQLFSAGQLLGANGDRGVLSRGFALVRDETQRALWRAEDVRQAQRLEIEFADGKTAPLPGDALGRRSRRLRCCPADAQDRTRTGGAGVSVEAALALRTLAFGSSGEGPSMGPIGLGFLGSAVSMRKPPLLSVGFPWISLDSVNSKTKLRRLIMLRFQPRFPHPKSR